MAFKGKSPIGAAAAITAGLVSALTLQVVMPQSGSAISPVGQPAAALRLASSVPSLPVPKAGPADSLWVATMWNEGTLGVCASPGASQALSSCFSANAALNSNIPQSALATDGTNVYIPQTQGAYSCPIADLGSNCTRIMAGPWPSGSDNEAIVAADGYIWVAGSWGVIYRCPNDLAYAQSSSAPTQCTKLDSLGGSIGAMLLANGTLYVGTIAPTNSHVDKSGPSGLVACDPQTVNSCTTLDSPSDDVDSMAAGAGHLFIGLKSGILWRCTATVNGCQNWDTAGSEINALSYDGAGTVYAAVVYDSKKNPGTIWSCPASTANSCSNYMAINNSEGVVGGVAAGDDTVFVGDGAALYAGTEPYSEATSGWKQPYMLYVPASGPAGVGAVLTRSSRGPWLRKLDRMCHAAGGARNARVTFRATGPRGQVTKAAVALRGEGSSRVLRATFDLLDPGSYAVTAQGRGNCGGKQFTKKVAVSVAVAKDRTSKVRVSYRRSVSSGWQG